MAKSKKDKLEGNNRKVNDLEKFSEDGAEQYLTTNQG